MSEVMKPSAAESALIALSQALSAVKAAKAQIGDALEASYNAQTANGGAYTDWLHLAYQTEHDDDGFRFHSNHVGDPEIYLADKCPHMLRAHLLIQERKALRRRLGAAKGRVTKLANELALREKWSAQ